MRPKNRPGDDEIPFHPDNRWYVLGVNDDTAAIVLVLGPWPDQRIADRHATFSNLHATDRDTVSYIVREYDPRYSPALGKLIE